VVSVFIGFPIGKVQTHRFDRYSFGLALVVNMNYWFGESAQRSGIGGSFETFAVKPFIHSCQHHLPRGRRSRPFQRGAAECQAWNERINLAAILRLRLSRAEDLCGVGRISDLPGRRP